jgi:hypothetical protein
MGGHGDEAMAAADGIVEAADATGNASAIANALLAYGFAFRDADPVSALDALRRGRVIALETGLRWNESHQAVILSGLEAEYGDPLAALDCFTAAIRNYHDSGNITMIRSPLAVMAVFFDRLGRHEAAATTAGYAHNLLTPLFTEIDATNKHLRAVLGNENYERLARAGAAMNMVDMVAYAYDQIDQARASLADVSK